MIFNACHRRSHPLIWVWLLLCIILNDTYATAQTVSSDVLARARKACIFIQCKDGEGSGFIFERTSSAAKIATAAHVICDEKGSVNQDIQVVVYSGTPSELTLKAKVLDIDSARDVAFLEVRARNLPEPIYLAPDAEVFETMDVVIAGFPYGEQLAVASKNPSLSISKGAVSSVRTSATNSTAVIQLDANINPGNSGGPVLNSKGDVIGLVQAKIEGTSLGFAIPASQVIDDLMGNLETLTLSGLPGSGSINLRVTMVDPLERLTKLQLAVTSITSLPSFDLQANKSWPLISSNMLYPIATSRTDGNVSIRLPVKGIPFDQIALQVVCYRVDGTTVNSRPFSLKSLIAEDKAQRERASRPPEPSPTPVNPDKPPGSIPKPAKPREPVIPLTVQRADVRSLQNLNQRPTNIESGILSAEVPLGTLTVRRVMIPHSRYAPTILWNDAGDKLLVMGDQTCVIDFPDAKRIVQYELPGFRTWAQIRGNEWSYNERGRIHTVDLMDGKALSQWQFNQNIELSSLALSDPWLIRTTDPNFVFLLNEQTHDVDKIALPDSGASEDDDDTLFISPDKTQLFGMSAGKLTRYLVSQGEARVEESVTVKSADPETAQLLPTSDAQVLLVLGNSGTLVNPKSTLIAYAAQNLSRQYVAEVPAYLRSVIRDVKQNRVILASLDKLWFWYPRDGKLQSMPFLRSAPTIDTMTLHPRGDTLAILCGSSGSHPALYLVQLNTSIRP